MENGERNGTIVTNPLDVSVIYARRTDTDRQVWAISSLLLTSGSILDIRCCIPFYSGFSVFVISSYLFFYSYLEAGSKFEIFIG